MNPVLRKARRLRRRLVLQEFYDRLALPLRKRAQARRMVDAVRFSRALDPSLELDHRIMLACDDKECRDYMNAVFRHRRLAKHLL